VYADFNQLTLNITLAALFSIRSDYDNPSTSSSNRAAVIVAAVEQAFTYFAARGATAMVVPEWVPTPDNVAFREAVQQLDTLVYDIIDSRAAAMARQQQQQPDSAAAASSSKPASADLLQSLLESVDDAGQPMSRTALRDELMTLLVAGQETSAILLGWAAALLAHNPKAQAAAAAEVAAVLGTRSSSSSSGGDAAGAVPGPGDLPQLPYLTAVVLEALRLWSPAYMVGRCAAKDVQLAGGYTLPAGTTCLVSPYLLHRCVES
jgi:cytochrome P450